MSEKNRVILGEDSRDGNEIMVARIRLPDIGVAEARNWTAWIYDANKGPRISVRADKQWILITESSTSGGKIYVWFNKKNGRWYYSTGIVFSFKADGWIYQGSSSSRGMVIFDSHNLLDFALEKIES